MACYSRNPGPRNRTVTVMILVVLAVGILILAVGCEAASGQQAHPAEQTVSVSRERSPVGPRSFNVDTRLTWESVLRVGSFACPEQGCLKVTQPAGSGFREAKVTLTTDCVFSAVRLQVCDVERHDSFVLRAHGGPGGWYSFPAPGDNACQAVTIEYPAPVGSVEVTVAWIQGEDDFYIHSVEFGCGT